MRHTVAALVIVLAVVTLAYAAPDPALWTGVFELVHPADLDATLCVGWVSRSQPGVLVSAGHCFRGAVVAKLDDHFYWYTRRAKVVSLGIGRDLMLAPIFPVTARYEVSEDNTSLEDAARLEIVSYAYGVRTTRVCWYSERGSKAAYDQFVDTEFTTQAKVGSAYCDYPGIPGMSGSPILYGGKIIGVLTHLYVPNPRWVFFTVVHRSDVLL